MKNIPLSPRNGVFARARAVVSAVGIFLAIPATFAQSETASPPVKSKVTAVTVYGDRAIVTRTARVELPIGESFITLESLPYLLIDETVQVNGRGTADATILDVSTKPIYGKVETVVDKTKTKALDDEIAAAEKAIRRLNDESAILRKQTLLLEQIEGAYTTPPAANTNAQTFSLENLRKFMDFSLETRSKIAAATQELDAKTEVSREKLSKLRVKLKNLQNDSQQKTENSKTVTVRVAATKAGSLDIAVAYTVYGASWKPAYDARLHSDARTLELAYHGIVRQGTGEDWENVALTLSTARPSFGSGAPVLSPWILDVMTAESVRTYSETFGGSRVYENAILNRADKGMVYQSFNGNLVASGSLTDVSGIGGGAGGGAPVPSSSVARSKVARSSVASVDSSTTSATFKIAVLTSVKSNNHSHKVSIISQKLDAQLQYQATPAMQETAFLSSHIKNTTEYPFLEGTANIFLDNAFVATSNLKSVMPSEKFELALGADEGVVIKRRIINRFTEETGLISNGKRVTYEFLITVTNNKKSVEEVVFKEALPLSRNEKIVVNLLSPAEKTVGTREKPGKEVSKEEGNKLVWRLKLQPGEKREIPLKFNVEYPEGVHVFGLN